MPERDSNDFAESLVVNLKTPDVDVQTAFIGVYDKRCVSGSKYAMSGLYTAFEARKESYAGKNRLWMEGFALQGGVTISSM